MSSSKINVLVLYPAIRGSHGNMSKLMGTGSSDAVIQLILKLSDSMDQYDLDIEALSALQHQAGEKDSKALLWLLRYLQVNFCASPNGPQYPTDPERAFLKCSDESVGAIALINKILGMFVLGCVRMVVPLLAHNESLLKSFFAEDKWELLVQQYYHPSNTALHDRLKKAALPPLVKAQSATSFYACLAANLQIHRQLLSAEKRSSAATQFSDILERPRGIASSMVMFDLFEDSPEAKLAEMVQRILQKTSTQKSGSQAK